MAPSLEETATRTHPARMPGRNGTEPKTLPLAQDSDQERRGVYVRSRQRGQGGLSPTG